MHRQLVQNKTVHGYLLSTRTADGRCGERLMAPLQCKRGQREFWSSDRRRVGVGGGGADPGTARGGGWGGGR